MSIPESFVNLERDRVFKSIKYISELAALLGSEKDITTLWLSGENLGAKVIPGKSPTISLSPVLRL